MGCLNAHITIIIHVGMDIKDRIFEFINFVFLTAISKLYRAAKVAIKFFIDDSIGLSCMNSPKHPQSSISALKIDLAVIMEKKRNKKKLAILIR